MKKPCEWKLNKPFFHNNGTVRLFSHIITDANGSRFEIIVVTKEQYEKMKTEAKAKGKAP
jgi:hypothetical protein